jgi:beta-lactamase class A
LYLQQLEQGKYSLSDSLGDYSSEYQLEQLINQSNNDSWAFFNDALGFPAQETYAHSLGLASFSTKTNSLSPNDMTTLLYQLYTGKLLTKEHTDLILSYMKDTNEEGYIPAALPASTTVYHKTGLLDDNVHDGAIVDDGTHTYVLTIFSNGKGYLDYDARANVFSEIITALNQSLNASH